MHGCLIAETVGRLKWKLVMHGHWTLDVYATVTLRSWKLNALNGENVELLEVALRNCYKALMKMLKRKTD